MPLFITTGEKVKVDTRDGRYLGRASRPIRPMASLAARSKARKRALDVLFEAELRGVDPLETLARPASRGRTRRSGSTAVELVEGVAAHRERIDELLTTYAVAGRWTGCRRSTATSCGSAPTSCCGATTCPTRSWSTRRSSSPEVAVDATSRRAFVNGLLGAAARAQAAR